MDRMQVATSAPTDAIGGEPNSTLAATSRRLTMRSINFSTWAGSCSRRPSASRSKCLSTTAWILERVEVRSVDDDDADGAPTEGAAVDATDGALEGVGDSSITRSWTLGGWVEVEATLGGEKPFSSTWPPPACGVSLASATAGAESPSAGTGGSADSSSPLWSRVCLQDTAVVFVLHDIKAEGGIFRRDAIGDLVDDKQILDCLVRGRRRRPDRSPRPSRNAPGSAASRLTAPSSTVSKENNKQLLLDEGLCGVKKPTHCGEVVTSDDEEEFHSNSTHPLKKARTGNSGNDGDLNGVHSAGGAASQSCSQSSVDSTDDDDNSQPLLDPSANSPRREPAAGNPGAG
ncbi:hypothetical protein Esi_0191_0059 [Ectocarpus siliculosus]|uniref:Uncharacterized protein n=1 Tax=Ectocarpus siliculosus TaxID=2880 RepID=D8LHF2_ECTSI|nr:hypothetical protein Esi_0191_0059 [Ectocarpus siliculosus]|eukprot:CBN80269.1 hypothetical protein Esi_0191_0059 [Ectocarpus siliculosus]